MEPQATLRALQKGLGGLGSMQCWERWGGRAIDDLGREKPDLWKLP